MERPTQRFTVNESQYDKLTCSSCTKLGLQPLKNTTFVYTSVLQDVLQYKKTHLHIIYDFFLIIVCQMSLNSPYLKNIPSLLPFVLSFLYLSPSLDRISKVVFIRGFENAIPEA